MNAIIGASAFATALPAHAMTMPAGNDPIFAAIENHRKLTTAEDVARMALTDFEDTLPPELTREPRCVVGEARELHTQMEKEADGTMVFRSKNGEPTGEFYYATTHEDIERNAPRGDSPQAWSVRNAWIGDRLTELGEDGDRLRAARAAAGITPYENAYSAAMNAQYEAAQELLGTEPTTIAGIIALIRYFIEDSDGLMPDGSDPLALLENCADALDKIGASQTH